MSLTFVDEVPARTTGSRRGMVRAFLLELKASGDHRWCVYREYDDKTSRQAPHSAGQSVKRTAFEIGITGVEYKVSDRTVFVRIAEQAS